MLTAKKNSQKSRDMIQIPKGTNVHRLLYPENGNRRLTRKPKWEILEEILKQLPKSKPDRAAMIIENALLELTELYPELEQSFLLVSNLLKRKIIGMEMTEYGYQNCEPDEINESFIDALRSANDKRPEILVLP